MAFDYTDISNFYNRVRALLNVSETSLSDALIDFPEKAPTATVFIKSVVSDWEEYQKQETEEQIAKFTIFQSCIVYQTAIYFYRYVKENSVKTRETPDIKIEYSTSTDDCYIMPLQETLSDLLLQLGATTDDTLLFYNFLVT